MEWGFIIPAVAIASGPVAWVATTWIRARHGYPIESEKGQLLDRAGPIDAERRVELLTTENGTMRGQISRLEERIRVLERIATDPAQRLDREIAGLRTASAVDVSR